MKIILTGASGFLGSIIKSELSTNHFFTVGRAGDIIADLSTTVPELPAADMVIHAAGKAHVVPKTASERQEFYDVNVTGTRNLLTGLENGSDLPRAFVFISTVAVYGLEEGTMINEDNALLATDAYGQSKVQAEQLVEQWCEQNNVICTIFRLPLIAGTNPPGNLRSMINGITKGYYFNIAGGVAKKSIVMASDVAAIIPKAADIGGTYNLTDGYHPSFSELASLIAKQLNKPEPGNLPSWIARIIGKSGDFLGNNAPLNSSKLKKITSDLTFDDSKAFQVLNWISTPVLKGFKVK